MRHTLMVLEDDDDLRSLLAQFLGDQPGYDVLEARSGPEAIALATRKQVDLLVTDVRMDGMDGLECLAALRHAHPRLKSIVITGYASEEAPARAVQLGADDYVYKPFKVRDLYQSVQRVLGASTEREGYFGLLKPFVRGLFGSSAAAAPSAEQLRDLAFQSFFVGVRSRKLNRDEALSIWDELERLQSEVPENPSQAYQRLIDRIAALSGSRMFVPRGAGTGVDPETFGRFYNRVREASISPEQVRVAPQLRLVPVESRAAAPILADLYDSVWG